MLTLNRRISRGKKEKRISNYTHASNNNHEKENPMPRLSTYDSDIAKSGPGYCGNSTPILPYVINQVRGQNDKLFFCDFCADFKI